MCPLGKGRTFEAKVGYLKGKQEIAWIKQNAPLSKSTVQNCSFFNLIFVFSSFVLKGELLWEYFAIFEKMEN